MMEKQRDSNIELLRIVLMSMIVLTHFYVHGIYNVLDTGPDHTVKEASKVGWIVVSLIDYHVVCFFFISGYYGIKTKLDSLVNYFVKLVFYAVITYVLWGVLQYGFELRKFLGPKNLMSNLSPFHFFGGRWWFAESYFYLMFVAPFINKGVDYIQKRMFAGLLCLFVAFLFLGQKSPFDPLTAIMVYLIGKYLKKWPIRFLEDKALWVYMTALLVLLANTIIHIWVCNDLNIRLSTDYNSPIVLIAGVSFFFVFKNMKMRHKALINWISGGAFGVYLLTDGFLRAKFNAGIVSLCGTNAFVLAIAAMAITLLLSAFNGFLNLVIMEPTSKLLSNMIKKLRFTVLNLES